LAPRRHVAGCTASRKAAETGQACPTLGSTEKAAGAWLRKETILVVCGNPHRRKIQSMLSSKIRSDLPTMTNRQIDRKEPQLVPDMTFLLEILATLLVLTISSGGIVFALL
jgi:pheromone shutdown protein TraB